LGSSSLHAKPSGRTLLASLALCAATLAVYAPVRGYGFFGFDDGVYVSENPYVAGGLAREGVAWAFSLAGHGANWHPLTSLSHMLDVELFGMSPGPQHLVSLALHLLGTLLLFGFLQSTTGAPGRSALVAALFAVHPLHVESVVWISARKDVLSGVLFVLTLWAWAWYARRPGAGRHALVAVSLALGLMAKPMLVTLPFVLLLLDVWPLGRLPLSGAGGPAPAPSRTWRAVAPRLVLEKLPLLALCAVSSALTLVVQRSWGAVATAQALPLEQRAANAAFAYVAYVGKTLWPAGLAAFYPPRIPSISGAVVAGCVLLLAAATAAAIRAGGRRPYLLVGWLWYLGMLVPVIGLVQVGDQAMADRYTYLPLIGLFVAAAWGLHDLAPAALRRTALPAAALLAVAACGLAARIQVGYWRSDAALWEHAAAVTSGNWVAEIMLANLLAAQGRLPEAIGRYEEALRVRPGSAEAHNGLGAALAEQGRFADAVPRYQEALRLRPGFAEAHNNLGNAYSQLDRFAEAEREFAEALRARPWFALAHANLGLALLRQGKADEAIRAFAEALRLEPGNPRYRQLHDAALEGKGPARSASPRRGGGSLEGGPGSR
jgi:tetratricopeptide (TPR) repeat protein